MEKKNIDWENLTFKYIKTDARYVSNYKDGKWDEGIITDDNRVILSESANVLHYSQTCFEGLKAYTTCDNKIVVFRPDMNAKRLIDSAKRLEIPPISEEKFIDAIDKVVRANAAWVPPYGTNATLYIRPVLFGSGEVVGVKPAPEYQFRIFCTPVGAYFKNGTSSSIVKVSDFDRAAPHGTGNIKAGLNYAMSLHPYVIAHEEGFDENLYLDPATRTKVEETGGANFFFVTKDGKIVTPKSPSILPSITRRSLMTIAKDMLGIEVEEREVYLSELENFVECGLCGTAAIISPVGAVNDHGKEIVFANSRNGLGPISKRMYDTLTGIQFGTIKGPEGWVRTIL